MTCAECILSLPTQEYSDVQSLLAQLLQKSPNCQNQDTQISFDCSLHTLRSPIAFVHLFGSAIRKETMPYKTWAEVGG